MSLTSTEKNNLLNRLTAKSTKHAMKQGGAHPMFILYKKGAHINIPDSFKKSPVTSIAGSSTVEKLGIVAGEETPKEFKAENGATIYTAYVTVDFKEEKPVNKVISDLVKLYAPDMVAFVMTIYYRDAAKCNTKLPLNLDPDTVEALFFVSCEPNAKPFVMLKPLYRPPVKEKQDDFSDKEPMECYIADSFWSTEIGKNISIPLKDPYTNKKI